MVTNYEIDKTVRVTRAAAGAIRRLAVAVVVNHRVAPDKKGQTQSQPLSQEEIDKLVALVQETVGFNKERGDTVRVVNAPFRHNLADKPAPVPMWQQPETVEMVRTLAVPLVLGLLGLALVFGVIRPVLGDLRADRLAQQPPAARQLDAVVDDLTELPALQGRSTLPTLAGPAAVSDADKRLEAVRQMARTNPASVARILRGWAQGQDAG